MRSRPRQLDTPLVLVTRTEPGASRQSEALRSLGLEAIKLPMIAIEPVPCDLGREVPDLVIVLSAHAVLHGRKAIDAWGGSATWLAVGSATANALKALNIEAAQPRLEASEGLLALVQLRECAGRRVAVLCGESPRPLLKETLSQRGAEVLEYPVYRRVPLTHVSDYHGHLLEASAVSAVIVSSVEGLRAFDGLWCSLQGPRSVLLCVNSQRAEQVAMQIGYSNLRRLTSQSPAAVAQNLADWLFGGSARAAMQGDSDEPS